MLHEIASAFSHRQRPPTVTTVAVGDSLRDDALHFAGKDWTEVTATEWIEYSDAYYGLTPDAFVYFLPSILTLSLGQSNGQLHVADAIVMSLDTSADPEIWPDWFKQRFGILTAREIEVLKGWAVAFLESHERDEGSVYQRVQDTLVMLELSLQS